MSEKKQYVAPELEVYGSASSLTQAFGDPQAQDFVFVGGSNVQNGFPSAGSVDGIIVPKNP